MRIRRQLRGQRKEPPQLTVSAIKHREEIQAVESKSAHQMRLHHIWSQRASATAGPLEEANNPPRVGATLVYDAAQSIHPGNSQDPSSVEKMESESPLSFEYSDSRDGRNRIPNPQTDALDSSKARAKSHTTGWRTRRGTMMTVIIASMKTNMTQRKDGILHIRTTWVPKKSKSNSAKW